MNEYTASNGITVHHGGGNEPVGGLRVREDDGNRVMLSGRNTQALREFFQAETDERLGRWRHPSFPDYVGYAWNGDVCIINEADGGRTVLAGDRTDHSDRESRFAATYFAAHPEPKPWEDAKPGEGWVLTIDGGEHLALVDSGGEFHLEKVSLTPGTSDMDGITAAHRIYPPADPS